VCVCVCVCVCVMCVVYPSRAPCPLASGFRDSWRLVRPFPFVLASQGEICLCLYAFDAWAWAVGCKVCKGKGLDILYTIYPYPYTAYPIYYSYGIR